MSSFLWHTSSDPTGNLLAIYDEEKTLLALPQFGYVYQSRAETTDLGWGLWSGRWPGSRMMAGSPSVPVFLGLDASDVGPFEPTSAGARGYYRPSYVMGQCIDSNGTALVGASVNLYTNGTLVSSGVSDGSGNYMLPTPYIASGHFVYAVSGTYVGASLNSLLPNF